MLNYFLCSFNRCINDWASRSVKDVIAREGAPEWRCPGCRAFCSS